MVLKRSAVGAFAALVAFAASGQDFDFSKFDVPLYRGVRAKPAFTGKGAEFFQLRTRIRNAFAAEKIAAGHYVVIQIGCGSGCTQNIVGDVKTGQLFSFPLSGEAYQGLRISTSPTSRLFSASWGFNDCTRLTYVLSGTKFVQIGKEEVSNKGCYD